MSDKTAPTSGAPAWDWLAGELQALRERAGNPSYAEIARRIGVERRAQGADEHAARVARSTVFDAFRPGRSRISFVFTEEVLRALGAHPGQLDEWIARAARPPDPEPGREPARPEPTRPGPPPATTVEAAPVPVGGGSPPAEVAPAPLEPAPPPVPAASPAGPAVSPAPSPPAPARSAVVLLLLGCVGVNLLGRVLVDTLTLPLHLDMVGTAVAALVLGPWSGAAVGVCTNLLGVASSGPASLAFLPVNVVGALVWGYGARRRDLGRSLPRFFLLCVLVALACSAVAVPTLYVLFGGAVGSGADLVTATVRDLTGSALLALGAANTLTSLVDKLLSGFLALVAVASLPWALRALSPLSLLGVTTPPESQDGEE